MTLYILSRVCGYGYMALACAIQVLYCAIVCCDAASTLLGLVRAAEAAKAVSTNTSDSAEKIRVALLLFANLILCLPLKVGPSNVPLLRVSSQSWRAFERIVPK